MPNPNPLFPLDKADRCVKCGLCLPHCPTYQLSQNEAESPRGRIMLMQGMASGQLTASPQLEAHLDRCLGCRSCESVCPADVPYGELIDAGRASLQQQRPARQRWLRVFAPWLTGASRRRMFGRLLRLLQRLGLIRLGRLFMPRLASLLPKLTSPPVAGTYPAIGEQRGQVQLFTGCVSELLDGQTLNDSIEVLNHCGFEVQLPAAQGCCGALHQHNGLGNEAQQLFQRNLTAFGDSTQPVLGTATGCTAMLAEYGLYAEGDTGPLFAARVADVLQFLEQHWPEALSLPPLPAKMLVHEPCSLRNVLGGNQRIMRLLARIPQANIQALPHSQSCCGAAGSMMLSQPEQADQLMSSKLEAVAALQPVYLLSSNIGCAMHLAGGLRRKGIEVEVLHPVSLLARLLRRAG